MSIERQNTRWQTTALGITLPLSGAGLLLAGATSQGGGQWLVWLIAVAGAFVIYSLASSLLAVRLRYGSCRPVPGKIAALFVSGYALAVCALCISAAVRLWQSWALPRTPFAVLAIMLALLCIYGAGRGCQALLRMGVLLVVLLVIITIVDTLLLLPEMEAYRLTMPSWNAVASTDLLAIGLILLLPLPPMLRMSAAVTEKKFFPGSLRFGIALAGAYLLLTVVRNVFLLGDLLSLDQYPLIRSLRLIEAGMGLSRLEYFGLLAVMAVALTGCMQLFSIAEVSWREVSGGRPSIVRLLFGVLAAGLSIVFSLAGSISWSLWVYLVIAALIFIGGLAAVFCGPLSKNLAL